MGIRLVITVDDRGGIMFNNRRQSRDSILIRNLCETVDGKIYVTGYSLPLFCEYEERVILCDSPADSCKCGETAFLEGEYIRQYIERADEIIVYSWNKVYPADKHLDVRLGDFSFILYGESEFVGSSHKKITKRIYKR